MARKKRVELSAAYIIFPGTVFVVVPAILQAIWPGRGLSDLPPALALFPLLGGLGLIITGLSVATWTVDLFVNNGQGTPSPWRPPKRFRITGPYEYVRNPMIIAIQMVLLGETVLIRSWPVLLWCVAFWVGNMIYFRFIVEPVLIKRFGHEYLEYKERVPRWIPREMPWNPVKKSRPRRRL